MDDRRFADWPLPGPGYDASLLLERCRRRRERAMVELGQRIRRDATACVQALCREHPELGGIGWRCYQPIYNDGSPAWLRARPVGPYMGAILDLGVWRAAEQAIERFRQAFPPEALRLAFGEEVEVRIDAAGNEQVLVLPSNHSREDL